jgi:hypothetical protein
MESSLVAELSRSTKRSILPIKKATTDDGWHPNRSRHQNKSSLRHCADSERRFMERYVEQMT